MAGILKMVKISLIFSKNLPLKLQIKMIKLIKITQVIKTIKPILNLLTKNNKLFKLAKIPFKPNPNKK
jgi:hypothetical protein